VIPARFTRFIERSKGQAKSRSVRGYTVGVYAVLRAMYPNTDWSNNMTMPSGGGYKSFASLSAS
jgi:hypothetical protein